MNYFAIGHLHAAGGVQVTASHNPAEYNGLKFSKREARPVSGDHGIPLLEAHGRRRTSFTRAERRGELRRVEVIDEYAEHVLSFLDRPARRPSAQGGRRRGERHGGARPRDLRGARRRARAALLRARRHLPEPRGEPAQAREPARPAGRRCSRPAPTSASPATATSTARRSSTRRGEPIGSDLVTALIAGELLAHEPGKHVLYDLRSSRAVAEYIREKGGIPVRERVGHSFMKATLRASPGPVRRRARRPLLLPRQLLRRLRDPGGDRGARTCSGTPASRCPSSSRRSAATPRARRPTSRSRTRPAR